MIAHPTPVQGSREKSNKLTSNAQVDNSGSEKKTRFKKRTVAEHKEKINEQVYYSGSEHSEKFKEQNASMQAKSYAQEKNSCMEQRKEQCTVM
jgi:hypothetical protein